MDDALPAQVLDFWFGAPPHVARDAWWRKDPAFDAEIRDRFGGAIGKALAGAYGGWCVSARGSLARVLLLDQFTRNAFRDTGQAFAGDARALATAQDAIARGYEAALDPFERWFLYMPFQHSEDREMQRKSLALFGVLAREPGFGDALDYPQRHAAIIERFGRFPHRNALLGRASTEEEIAFLREPGSSF